MILYVSSEGTITPYYMSHAASLPIVGPIMSTVNNVDILTIHMSIDQIKQLNTISVPVYSQPQLTKE